MMNIKRCVMGLAIAAVLSLGARASHAQTNYWPNGQPYACTYLLQNGSTGVALVTISLGSGSYSRSGTVTNLYPNGSATVKPIIITFDLTTGDGFGYKQTQDNITCELDTFEYGRHLVFSMCSNGNRQDCRQW